MAHYINNQVVEESLIVQGTASIDVIISSGTISISSTQSHSYLIDMKQNKIINLATCSTALEAANKGYIDTSIANLSTLKSKNGFVNGASFSGNPKKFNVVFSGTYSTTNYSIIISGEVSRNWISESKLTTGFTINASANQSFIEKVYWSTKLYGED